MLVDLDGTLLDRVFQPWADATSGWASCFGFARAALVVGVESQALTLVWEAMRVGSPANLALTALIAGLTVAGAWQSWNLIRRAERQTRSGAMNVRRITLRWQRLLWLGMLGCCGMAVLPRADLQAAFAILACAAWVAVIYFVSCTPTPPRRRPAGRLAPAMAPAPR